jgi:hypothetical protein
MPGLMPNSAPYDFVSKASVTCRTNGIIIRARGAVSSVGPCMQDGVKELQESISAKTHRAIAAADGDSTHPVENGQREVGNHAV